MSAQHTNGNGLTWRWLVGLLIAVVGSISGWTWSATTERVRVLEDVSNARGERVMRLETNDVARKEQLDRMEAKIDRLSIGTR